MIDRGAFQPHPASSNIYFYRYKMRFPVEGTPRGHVGLIEEAFGHIQRNGIKPDRGKKPRGSRWDGTSKSGG